MATIKILTPQPQQGAAAMHRGQGAPVLPPLRSLAEFHNDPRYGGDFHRADLAWARHAAVMGLSASEIREAIMEPRDLAKKGDPRRQREYAERTAGKALRQAEAVHRANGWGEAGNISGELRKTLSFHHDEVY